MNKRILLSFGLAACLVLVTYSIFFQNKLKVTDPVSKDLINIFSSEYFGMLTLKYPKYYSVQDGSKAFKVLTVSKNEENKIEVFDSTKIDPRTIISEPKEKEKKDNYDVWIYYKDTENKQTISELHQIYNSIEIK